MAQHRYRLALTMHWEGASNCGLLDIDIWLRAVGACPNGRPGPCSKKNRLGLGYLTQSLMTTCCSWRARLHMRKYWCQLYQRAADMGILLKHRVGNSQI